MTNKEKEALLRSTQIVQGVHVVTMPNEKHLSVCAWTNGKVELDFIFLGGGLNRRQRGREIRKGLRFHQKRRMTNE